MDVKEDELLDARGLKCPMPSVKTALILEQLDPGSIVRVLIDDPVSKTDLPQWVKGNGHHVLGVDELDDHIEVYVKKGA